MSNHALARRANYAIYAICAIAACAAPAGCSYATIQGRPPPPKPSPEPPDCTLSEAAPVVDTTFGVGLLVLGGGFLLTAVGTQLPEVETDKGGEIGAWGAIFAAAGAAFYASRVRGYRHVDGCRRAFERHLGLEDDSAEEQAVAP